MLKREPNVMWVEDASNIISNREEGQREREREEGFMQQLKVVRME